MPQVGLAAVRVAQVVYGNNSKRADRGEHAYFASAQVVVVSVHVDPLTFKAAREVEITREDVPHINAFDVPRIVWLTIAAVERTRVEAVPHISSSSGGPQVRRQLFM